MGRVRNSVGSPDSRIFSSPPLDIPMSVGMVGHMSGGHRSQPQTQQEAMTNRTNRRPVSPALPIEAGDIIVEPIGSEIRFWRVLEGGDRVTPIASSTTFRRQRILELSGRDILPSQRYIEGGDKLKPSAFWSAKGYGLGLDLARELLPDAESATFHICYAGNGPSGNYSLSFGRESFPAEQREQPAPSYADRFSEAFDLA